MSNNALVTRISSCGCNGGVSEWMFTQIGPFVLMLGIVLCIVDEGYEQPTLSE